MAEQATHGPTLATPANMREWERLHPSRKIQTPDGSARIEGARCFAYSPNTGEEYSATAGDYYNRPDDQPIRDKLGEPMVLAVRVTQFLDALTGEDFGS